MSAAAVTASVATMAIRGAIVWLLGQHVLAYVEAVLHAAKQVWLQSPAIAALLVAMNTMLLFFLADRVIEMTGALTRRFDQ